MLLFVGRWIITSFYLIIYSAQVFVSFFGEMVDYLCSGICVFLLEILVLIYGFSEYLPISVIIFPFYLKLCPLVPSLLFGHSKYLPISSVFHITYILSSLYLCWPIYICCVRHTLPSANLDFELFFLFWCLRYIIKMVPLIFKTIFKGVTHHL